MTKLHAGNKFDTKSYKVWRPPRGRCELCQWSFGVAQAGNLAGRLGVGAEYEREFKATWNEPAKQVGRLVLG
jgi:hypothetical protein